MRIDLHQYDELIGLVPPVEVPPPLTAAWRMVGMAWEQPAAHDALVGLAIRHGQLGWLASRYRERQSDPIAERELERVQSAATVVLLAAPRAVQARPAELRRAWWSIALCAVLAVGALAGARGAVRHATGPTGAPALVAP